MLLLKILLSEVPNDDVEGNVSFGANVQFCVHYHVHGRKPESICKDQLLSRLKAAQHFTGHGQIH